MHLDPEAFRREPGDIYWQPFTTPRHGQFDIATVAGEDWGPDATGLAHLEHALKQLDDILATALPAAEGGWAARYKAALRSREAWSIVRLFADATGRIVISLNEDEFDTYCLWDVTLVDGRMTNVAQRIWGGTPSS